MRVCAFIFLGEHLEDVKLVGEDPKTSIIDGQGLCMLFLCASGGPPGRGSREDVCASFWLTFFLSAHIIHNGR